MSNFKIASRYALSLFELAKEKKATQQVLDDLTNLAHVYDQSADFKSLMNSPLINSKVKKASLESILKNSHELTRNTLLFMTDKKRENLLKELVQAYYEYYQTSNNIVNAVVTSATAITDKEKAGVESFVKKHTNAATINIENKIDTAIIGGLKINFNGQLFDSSISTQINKLKKELNII